MHILSEKKLKTKRLRVTPRPSYKCRACVNYNIKRSCPVFVPSWQESKQFIKTYKYFLLIQYKLDNTKDFELEKKEAILSLLEKEKELLKKYTYAYTLFPGNCNLCLEDCSKNNDTCKNKADVRPSTSAMGIELDSVISFSKNYEHLWGIILLY